MRSTDTCVSFWLPFSRSCCYQSWRDPSFFETNRRKQISEMKRRDETEQWNENKHFPRAVYFDWVLLAVHFMRSLNGRDFFYVGFLSNEMQSSFVILRTTVFDWLQAYITMCAFFEIRMKFWTWIWMRRMAQCPNDGRQESNRFGYTHLIH